MSNVPSWKRSISKAEYLYQTYQLTIEVGKMAGKVSKKSYSIYGEKTMQNCMDALYHGRCAENIFVGTSEQLLNARLYEIAQMRANIDNVGTLAYLWMESIRKHEGIPAKDNERYYNFMYEVGDRCDLIIKLLDGLKRSDKDLFRKRVEKKETKQQK